MPKFGLDGETCGVLDRDPGSVSRHRDRGVEDAPEHREGHSEDELDISAPATRG